MFRFIQDTNYSEEQRRRRLKRDLSRIFAIPCLSRTGKVALQPEGMTRLFSHQHRAVARMQEVERMGEMRLTGMHKPIEPRGGVLCDPVGFGKTAEVLALILSSVHFNDCMSPSRDYKSTRSNLIIMPDHLLKQWVQEALKMAPALRVLEISTVEQLMELRGKGDELEDMRSFLDGFDCTVVPLNLAGGNNWDPHHPLYRVKWYRVVLDECHDAVLLSNSCTQVLSRLDTTRFWCVSGTPFPKADDSVYGINVLLHIKVRFHLNDSPFVRAGDALPPSHPFESLKKLIYIRNPMLNDEEKEELGIKGCDIDAIKLSFTKNSNTQRIFVFKYNDITIHFQ